MRDRKASYATVEDMHDPRSVATSSGACSVRACAVYAARCAAISDAEQISVRNNKNQYAE